MERGTRRMVGSRVEVAGSALVGVAVVGSGLGVALPTHAPGHADASYWATAAVSATLFIGCLLVHGLVQAVAARSSALTPEVITLWPFGGVVKVKEDEVTPSVELRIAAAGLFAFGLLAAGLWYLAVSLPTAGASRVGVVAADWLARLIAIVAAIHVLPAAPLGGGRVMRAILGRRYGSRNAAVWGAAAGRLASWIVVATAVVALLAGAIVESVWLILTALVLFAGRHLDDTQRPMTVSDVMTADPVVAPGWLTVEAFLEDYRHALLPGLPVKRFSGEIDGLVSWERLNEVPETRRSTTRVSEIASPLNEVVTVGPRQKLSDLRGRLSDSSLCAALVLDQGRLVGIVAPSDVGRRGREGDNSKAQGARH